MVERKLEDHPYFSEHDCPKCVGVGKEFYCPQCDVESPGDCLHVTTWLDELPDWDKDAEEPWNEEG